MTSSSSPTLERGLDTMILVYSLLQRHPAFLACQQFLRGDSGWFTPPLILAEARNILTKVYSVDPARAAQELSRFASGPVAVLGLDQATMIMAFQLANTHGLDIAAPGSAGGEIRRGSRADSPAHPRDHRPGPAACRSPAHPSPGQPGGVRPVTRDRYQPHRRRRQRLAARALGHIAAGQNERRARVPVQANRSQALGTPRFGLS
jgi:hypothetical protein